MWDDIEVFTIGVEDLKLVGLIEFNVVSQVQMGCILSLKTSMWCVFFCLFFCLPKLFVMWKKKSSWKTSCYNIVWHVNCNNVIFVISRMVKLISSKGVISITGFMFH